MSKKPLTVGSLKENQPTRMNKSMSPPQPMEPPNRKTTAQPLIKLKQHDHTFTLTPHSGRTILDCALSQNQPIDYKCGKGNCEKCLVKVVAGSALISPPTAIEWSKLNKRLAEGFRLACQTKIN